MTVMLLFVWAGICLCLSGIQEEAPLIENPNTPLSQKGGRSIRLREELRITDEAGDFIFRSPRRIQTGEEGTIYLSDKGDSLGREIVYMFRNGKFIKNLVRIGQGPGEFPMGVGSFFSVGDSIVLVKFPDKLVWYDSNGNQAREVPLAGRIRHLLGYDPPNLIGTSLLTAEVSRKNGIRTSYYPLKAIDENGTIMPIPVTLFTKDFYGYPSGGGVYIIPITEILSAFGPPDKIYISHTVEYLISVFECAKRRVVLRFKRDYQPVKKNSMKGSPRSLPNVENDVQMLFARNDEIWVLTSSEKDKNPLIDVFDRQGRYIDAFYLPLDVRTLKDKYGLWYAMTIFDDLLYVVQTDQKDDMALVKYVIEE